VVARNRAGVFVMCSATRYTNEMPDLPEPPVHVGIYIRQGIIPVGMSVKAAAERLGVSRPALSNLLNGRASLSSEMALRLEKAFGADRQKLLQLQAKSDRDRRREGQRGVAVSAYVPLFLTIKARQIEGWAADNLEARQDLPVLLRKLVQSTGRELRQVDFPGYDNAQRKGWDGWIEANEATPWIPEGASGWEFGTNQDPRAKAEKDYAARLISVPPAERAKCTLVFVTPRNWAGKVEWAQAKNATGDWKAVRALDASDLEQWLEVSIPAQMWLAEKLNLPTKGFETLELRWQRWSIASDPPMSPDIFEPSINAYRAKLKEWLEQQSERPFIIAADSTDEALAFLACLFKDNAIAPRWKDLAAVFDSGETLKTLASSSSPFLPIVFTEEAERELPALYRRLHCITVRPRNAVDTQPDIALDLLGYEAFQKALTAMGFTGDDVERLARESGRSPTILRRRLSKIEAIRTPQWARNAEGARSLIPMALVGAWHAKSKADCEVLSTLSGGEYEEIEKKIAQLQQLDDPPVWSVGQYRGVTSKLDSLFATSKSVTQKDLEDFFVVAEYVLSESDPALDLPEDQRWAAGLYGKVRDHSAALREGICETLVILAVHGNALFRDRLGLDVGARVALLIRQLLSPLTLEKLLSQDRDLPRYAEAAPDEFLKLIEADLKQPSQVVHGLLRPASGGIFAGCPRTGLLWALECLAWKPQQLPRVIAVLAQLSRTKIDDNWANKPIASLKAIFRCWMPQTAASLPDRMKVLETLTKQYPDIGWQICIEQVEPGTRVGTYSYRPRWRSDGSGAGQPVTEKEAYDFSRKALDLALAWPNHNKATLGNLVECLAAIGKEDQAAVWNLIEKWSEAESDDNTKAALREQIRRFAFTRWGRGRGLEAAARNRAREAYARLESRDPVIRHAWLFAKQWVEASADEIQDEAYDFSRQQERIHERRIAAMNEIWSACGIEGVMTLLSGSGAESTAGQYVALCVQGSDDAVTFLRRCLSIGDAPGNTACIQGFLLAVEPGRRAEFLSAVAEGADANYIVQLYRAAPFGQDTWRLLDTYSDEIREKYWREVFPYSNRHSDGELTELLDRLLDVQRPRAAFFAVHMDWERIETSRLKRLLFAAATGKSEPAGSLQLDSYSISAALESLDGRPGVSSGEMAQLEFMYLRALDTSEHGIPNLERQISESPTLFVQALALTYPRSDGGQDPPEWRIDDPELRAIAAVATHRLLDQVRRLPGTDRAGNISTEALTAWLNDVRELCAQYGRSKVGDHCIGQLLSKAPAGGNGGWPSPPVCEAMERIASEDMADGFVMGVYHARGVQWRGEGGAQERELAAKYRGWAQQVAFEYPYVSGVLEMIVSSYESEGEWHDSEAKVRRRLRQ
jgi:addiction module HigA family antidote